MPPASICVGRDDEDGDSPHDTAAAGRARRCAPDRGRADRGRRRLGEARRRRASGDWTNFGNTVDENRYSPLTQITPGNVAQLGRAFTFDLNKAVPGIKKGQQSYPIVVNGDDLHHLRRRPGLRGQRRDRRHALALRARQPRHLQELRHRRQPRRRLLRQPDLPADARHDDRRARPGDRASSSRASRSAVRSPGAYAELRLLGDERPDLREPHRRRRRGRLRLRRPRLRDGVPHRSHPGLGEPVLDRSRRPAPSGAASRRLVGGATNWTPETVDPTTNTLYFGTGGGVARRTTRRCGRARTRAPTRWSPSTSRPGS